MNNIAVILGNGLNAHSIVQSLKRSSFDGGIHVVRDSNASKNFADWLNRNVESWCLPECSAKGLVAEICRRFSAAHRVFVFFTDERFHSELAQAQIAHLLPSNVFLSLGSALSMETILDRLAFCLFIDAHGLGKVPRTISGEEDPLEAFGARFILRPRESWQSPSRREKVQIIEGRKAWETAVRGLEERGLGKAGICYQELLSIEDRHNVSICGWFSKQHKHIFCTRKVLQHPPGHGDGDVVERIDPPDGIMSTAKSILKALDYEGPFELEFVLDTKDKEYKVIELNPRFWLQHGLIEAISGCSLVARYSERGPLEVTEGDKGLHYWVHPLYALFRALKGDLWGLRYLGRSDAWTPMGMGASLALLPKLALTRLLCKMK